MDKNRIEGRDQPGKGAMDSEARNSCGGWGGEFGAALLPEPGEKLGPPGFDLALICRISSEIGDAIGVGLEIIEFVGRALAEAKPPVAAGFPRGFHSRRLSRQPPAARQLRRRKENRVSP